MQCCRKKPLKVVITSATLDGEKLSAYFGDCPVLTVPGRVFDVQLIYSKDNHEGDIMTAAAETALQIHLDQPEGDILVFLTGQAEIDKAHLSPRLCLAKDRRLFGTCVEASSDQNTVVLASCALEIPCMPCNNTCRGMHMGPWPDAEKFVLFCFTTNLHVSPPVETIRLAPVS